MIRVPRRPGSEGFGSPPVGTLLMRVPWGPESWLVRENKQWGGGCDPPNIVIIKNRLTYTRQNHTWLINYRFCLN